MQQLKISGQRTLGLLACMAVVLAIAEQTVGAWNTTRKVPYFGYYFVQDEEMGFNYINEVNGYANVVWISPDHSVLTQNLGAQYDNAGLKLIVDLGISQERLDHPTGADMTQYLNDTFNELNNANLWDNVIAIAPAEEWHNRVIYGVEKDWQMFSPYTEQTIGNQCGAPPDDPSQCWIKARRDFLVSKLQNLVAVIKTRFPDKAALLVDTSWSNDYNMRGAGSFWYHPVPTNLDVLGLDAYMTSIDFTADCGAAMQQKFIDEVRWEYDHVLANYSQQILVVGQAFQSEPAGGSNWYFPMPGLCQLNWWYSLAQSSSRFFGLTWFAYGLDGSQSSDHATGVRNFSGEASWLRNMYLHNQSIPTGAPDALASGQSLLVGQSRTSIDGQFRLVYESNGNLLLYGPGGSIHFSSCTEGTSPGQVAMQGDGNFVIYNGSGSPIWFTATDGNPGSYLAVQPDGNLVIYTPGSPNTALWNIFNTGCRP